MKKQGLLLVSALLVSCSHVLIDENEHFKAIAKAERVLDEWGTAGVSAPVLTDIPSSIKFDLKKDAASYYDDARKDTNAAISYFNQTLASINAGASVQEDAVAKASYAEKLSAYSKSRNPSDSEKEILKQKAEKAESLNELILDKCKSVTDTQLADAGQEPDREKRATLQNAALSGLKACIKDYRGSDSSLEYPKLDSSNVPALVDPLTGSGALVSGFKDPYGGWGESPLKGIQASVPNSSALSQAYSNYELQEMLSMLSNNKVWNDEKNNKKATYIGVATVSVNPGYRTARGYKANINLEPKFQYKIATDDERDIFINNLVDVAKKSVSDEADMLLSFMSTNGTCSMKVCNDYKEIMKKSPHSSDSVGDAFNKIVKKYGVPLGPESCDSVEADRKICIDHLLDNTTLVTALSPLNVGQSLDLSGRIFQQMQASLALASALRSAGSEAQEKILLEFAKQREGDYLSRNIENNINISNQGTSNISIEVAPEFYASRTNDSIDGPDRKLVRQTFPIIFRVTPDAGEKEIIAFDCASQEDKNAKKKDLNALRSAVEIGECWPQLYKRKFEVRVTNRWMLEEKSIFPDFFTGEYQLSSADLKSITDDMYAECDSRPDSKFIKSKCNELGSKLLGTFVFMNIPEDKAAPTPQRLRVTKVFPSEVLMPVKNGKGDVSFSQKFVISGERLNQAACESTKVSVGAPHVIESIACQNGVIEASIRIKSLDPVILKFKDLKTDADTYPANGDAIAIIKQNPQAEILQSYSVEMNEGNVNVTFPKSDTKFRAGVDGVLKSAIEKNKPVSAVPEKK